MQIHIILEPDVTPAEVTELGLLAENVGIQGLWVQNYATARDPFMTLVPLARESKSILLGVVVVSPYEMHPLKLATSLLTLNDFAPGRAGLVLGGGGEWPGIMGVGYPRRVRSTREALEIVAQAAEGKGITGFLNYEGEIYRSRYYQSPWADVSRGKPRIYVGATKTQMLRMTATHAPGTMLADCPLEMLTGKMAVIEETLAERGRPRNSFCVNDFVGWHVKKDREEMMREARRELVIRAWLSDEWIGYFLAEDEVKLVQQKKSAFVAAYRDRSGDIKGVPASIVNKLIDGLTFASTLQEIGKPLERLERFRAAGVDEMSLRLHDKPWDAIRIIGEHVIPRFK